MNEKPAVELRNVTVIYNEGSANEVRALDDVSLSIESGETVVIVGGNGSGKSTLLRAIAGTAPVVSGEILLHGVNVTGCPAFKRARRIGFVHQDPLLGTCPNLTIHENFQLASPRPWWSLAPLPAQLEQAQSEALVRTGLPLQDRAATPVSMLSGGQRQALSLCLAFSAKHRFIFLFDEFTSALDKETTKASVAMIAKESARARLTLILVLHAFETVQQLGTRVVAMTNGTLTCSSV